MLAHSPVVRSTAARNLFLASAVVTVLILVGICQLRSGWVPHGLTPIFFMLFAIYDYHGAMCSLLILACAACVPARPAIRTLLRRIGERPAVVAAATTAVLGAGAVFVYLRHPLSMDEYTVLFQSQVFAAGHLNGHLPASLLDWLIAPGFHTLFFNASESTGKVVSAYWPSFALLMTPFTLVGIPWACNPVVSGATVMAIHRLTLRLFEEVEVAGLAVLFTVASPVFFADGISYYSMQAHLLANSLYALLLIQPTPRRALWAGVVGSIALTLHNPVPHLLFAAPWIVRIALREDRRRVLGPLIAGYLPLCMLLGLGWFLFAGHLMHEGLRAAAPATGSTLWQRIMWPFALPSRDLLLARAIGIAKICLWAVPGLVILAAAGAWRHRHDWRCATLTVSALVTFAGYLFVWSDQGHGWGFRFFHSAWMVLPVLGAGALARRPDGVADPESPSRQELRSFVVACALGALVFAVGLRGVQIRSFMSRDLAQLPRYGGTEPRIVLIDAGNSFYGIDLVQNDPWLRGTVIRLLSHGASADAALVHRLFPGFHRAFADIHGTVWSATLPARDPRSSN